jgi:hypothetical protein
LQEFPTIGEGVAIRATQENEVAHPQNSAGDFKLNRSTGNGKVSQGMLRIVPCLFTSGELAL